MRKIQLLGLALIAVFSFGAIAASAAFALPEWLVEKAEVLATLSSESEGLLELIQFTAVKGTTKLVSVDCEGVLDGTIGPVNAAGKGVDTITKVLSLNMEEIGESLSGLALECKVVQTAGSLTDCKLNTTALVWPENLPWTTELELMTPEPTLILDVVTKKPAYDVECESVLGPRGSELCEGNTSLNLTNEAMEVEYDGVKWPASVLAEGSEAVGTERGECASTGKESGINIGLGNIWATAGELLRLVTEVDD